MTIVAFEHFQTDLEKEKEYPKLVRDKIPEVVEEITGKKVGSRILENDEKYLYYLQKKIEEEAQELAQAKEKKHVIEEVADLLELIDAFSVFYDIDHDEIKKVQEEKRRKRGGFSDRILMLDKVDN
jgi:predicted house-cleaning noncanonical NTP pyrophosphatase (MazG superfamily)